MRDGMMINSILANSSVWYGLTEKQLTELELADEYLIRKILNCHAKVPKEFLYQETGLIMVRHIIKRRRIMYLHHLLTREKSELISKIYYSQKMKPVKGDWAVTVEKDCHDLNIDIESIKLMKKQKFKIFLKEKISKFAFNYLQEKKMSHSKVKNLQYANLSIQPYITDTSMSTVEKQMLLSLRSRCSSSRANFRSMYEDVLCNLCDSGVTQNDAHLLDCVTIIKNCPKLAQSVTGEHEDIYNSDTKIQQVIAQLYLNVFETKSILDEKI